MKIKNISILLGCNKKKEKESKGGDKNALGR